MIIVANTNRLLRSQFLRQSEILSVENDTYIHTYTLFNLEFRLAKDKLVSSSYKYDSKYC